MPEIAGFIRNDRQLRWAPQSCRYPPRHSDEAFCGLNVLISRTRQPCPHAARFRCRIGQGRNGLRASNRDRPRPVAARSRAAAISGSPLQYFRRRDHHNAARHPQPAPEWHSSIPTMDTRPCRREYTSPTFPIGVLRGPQDGCRRLRENSQDSSTWCV